MWRKIYLIDIGLVKKKNQTGVGEGGGRGGGLRIWKFQWYQRYSMCNFQGLIKKEVKLLRVAKKNNVKFPGGLDFWSRNFQGI